MSQFASDTLMQSIDEWDHIQGAITAPVILVKYGDYQCPHSAEAHRVVQQIQQRYGDRLCFVFRHFPLTQIHRQAQKAAEAAEVAARQGRFWQMHNLLFERQQALDDGSLVEYAMELGLHMPRFLWNFSQHVCVQRIQANLLSGIESGVTGTPTFFINGNRLHDSWEMDGLCNAIDQAHCN